jgi:hypothetical protein
MSSYGDRYWRIGVAKDPLNPEKDSEEDVYIHADELEVSNCGALIAWGGHRSDGKPLLSGEKIIVCAFAPGQWFYFFAASVFDGSPVCVEEHD